MWHAKGITQFTVTYRFQTTIPLEVRQALNLKPRQLVSYELQPDGAAVMRLVPRLEELFRSLKRKKPAASAREEKQAARDAVAHEASGEGRK